MNFIEKIENVIPGWSKRGSENYKGYALRDDGSHYAQVIQEIGFDRHGLKRADDSGYEAVIPSDREEVIAIYLNDYANDNVWDVFIGGSVPLKKKVKQYISSGGKGKYAVMVDKIVKSQGYSHFKGKIVDIEEVEEGLRVVVGAA
jgi:hypothetical protein